MTEVVDKVLLALKGNNTEKKIEAITKLEDELLEQTPLEPQEISQLVPNLRDALKGSQQQVSYAVLVCLNPFISLISETHPTSLKHVITAFTAAVIDKLGDNRDKARDAASNILVTMWESASANGGNVITTPLVTIIKESAFGHKQWRVREQILQWIVICTRRFQDFSIKHWLPYLVKSLEDPHEQVRETAKDKVVLLFSGAVSHAKSDLKRELERQSVRPAIVEYILSKMGSNNVEINDDDNVTEPTEEDYMSGGTQNEETSRSIECINRPSSPADSEIGVIHVDSAKELEKEFQNLSTPFSGKESEQNWMIREKGINKLRSLTRGDAASQYPDVFVNGLKLIMDGIFTSLVSLRTTLTLATSGLIKDLASHLKTALDPFADNLLANLIKMVSSTKKIVAKAAANSANALLQYCSYHARLVNQLWHAMEEKNTQLRTYTIGFVKTVIQAHNDRRDAIERTGGAESLEKCVRKGLTDAAPNVREGCREVFWTFYEVWSDKGEKILKNLEPAVKKKLERDRPKNLLVTSSSPSTLSPRRSTTPAPRGRARSSSMGKSRRLSIPRSDSASSDNYPMPNDSPKNAKDSLKSGKSTNSPPILRAKSPAPPSMRNKSAASTPTNSIKSPSKLLSSPQNRKGSPNSQAQNLPPREPTIIEKLESSDWNVRIGALLNVAQSVVRRSLEPSQTSFKKADEELGPVLLNMLNDPNPKVIENFLDPNVVTEMAKVIRLENLIPRLLLIASDEDKSEQTIIVQNLFPEVKNAIGGIGGDQALAGLNKCLSLLNAKKSSTGPVFTLPQKRKVLNGLLLWLNEIIEPKLEIVENEQELTGYLGDQEKYKLLTSRLIPLANNTKETSENYQPLSKLLVNLHKLNPDAFETILFSFEPKIVDLVGNMVGWEEELEEAEEEVLAEEQAKLMEEQEREWEQQQLERQQMIAEQKNQLAMLQQQKQEQLERQQREREMKKQREREAQLQRERELQEQRERELQLQKERELQMQRERELQQQQLRELQQQRQERELQKQRERELQKQRERELQKQRELELQQQRELELQQQREFELQQQHEFELQQQREFELQQQREFELQQREFELQKQREFEAQQREFELKQQREAELQQQREIDEYELREHSYAQRPPPLQLQSSNKFPSQNTRIKDNINDWVENQRAPHLMPRGDDLRSPKERDIFKEQEARRNRPKTAEPQWPDPRSRDIDRMRRTKTPTIEHEYERRAYRDNGNLDERERYMSRDADSYERDDRYEDRRRDFEQSERGRRPAKDERSRMLREKTPHKENSWNERDRYMTREYEYDERDRRVPRELREHELEGRNQRSLRDLRDEEWDGRDRRLNRGSNRSDSDERLSGKRSIKTSKSTEWDRHIPRERDLRENDWDDVSSRSSAGRERDLRDDWEERSVRSLPKDLRENDWDEKSSQQSLRRDQEWDDRFNRLRPRESRESLEGKNTRPSPRFPRENDWDEKSLKASPRDPRRNDWDERNLNHDHRYPNNKTSERGSEWIDRGRRRSRDSDLTENTDKPNESHEEDEDTISEFDLNQSGTKERDMSKPVGRVVSLPPPPHDLGYKEFDDKDPELENLKELVEKLDMEEDDIQEENAPVVDMTISRPASIFITEDTWNQLANTLNGNINPFYLNPEERFKNDNNGTDAKLAPIQEDEMPEPTHIEEKSKSLDVESPQTAVNDLPLTSSDNTISPKPSNVSEVVSEEVISEEVVSEEVLQNTDSETIKETDTSVIPPNNTAPIPEEPSPNNMSINNIPTVVELSSPASPASSVGSGNSISGARDRALRRAQRFNSGLPLPGAAQERRLLLVTLLARLHDHDTDINLFRKLIVISKETPLSDRELAEDIWENGDRFVELMNALIGFLSDSEQPNNELREGAIMLLGQLINNQSDYTRGQERDILRVLLECRADPAVCRQVDDILDNYTQIVNANVGLYALIDIMESNLFNTFGSSPSSSPQLGSKTLNIKGSAFVVLSKLVKRFDKKSLERQVGSIVPLAIKGFSDPKPEIRKSVVDALVAIYSVIGDDNTLFQYLGSLNAAQQNLLNYYFDRSRKQRSTSSPGRGIHV